MTSQTRNKTKQESPMWDELSNTESVQSNTEILSLVKRLYDGGVSKMMSVTITYQCRSGPWHNRICNLQVTCVIHNLKRAYVCICVYEAGLGTLQLFP